MKKDGDRLLDKLMLKTLLTRPEHTIEPKVIFGHRLLYEASARLAFPQAMQTFSLGTVPSLN